MRKLFLLLLFLFTISFTVACSNSAQLENQAETYFSHWNNEEFSDMYNLLSSESKNKYTKEDFIDRYKKIYKDINVENLNVSYEMPDQDKIDASNQHVTIPIEVSLDSSAGPISFKENLTFTYEEKTKDEKASWKADWNPNLIFPDLDDGGKLSISTVEPVRGDILDRNDMPLALNDTTYEIGIIPNNFSDEKSEKQHIANLLNISVKNIDNALNEPWVEPDLFVPLKKIQKDNSYITNQVADIPAAAKKEVDVRTYPLGAAAAHLIGYVGSVNAEDIKKHEGYSEGDLIGKRGLEQLYEKELKGSPGIKISVIQEDNSENILAEKSAEDGKTISLALDVNIQEEIFDSFKDKAGTASAIDPKTGEVLALVSSPAFDPNSFVLGGNQSQLEKLENDPQLPLINRFTATFAPGSVIKPITAAIGLKNNGIDPDEGLEINGLTWQKDNWGNSKVKRVSTSNSPVDLNDALVRSDNIYFAMQAVEMGNEKFEKGLKEFGFEEDLPTAYPMKQSTISNEGNLSDEALLAHTSYGQGQIEMSALHLASSYSAIINDGTMLKPRILKSDEKETWKKDLVTKEQAKMLQETLRSVVTDGTAKVAKKADFPMAGKTGTAELKSSLGKGGSENGWFVGYPDDQKNIMIAMMVEESQNDGASSMVAEKVTDILIELRNKKIHSD